MSDPKLEVEAEVNITPPTNEATIKNEGDAAPASEKSEDVKPESKDTEINGTSSIKEEEDEKKDEKKPKTYDNGILKTTRTADESGDYKKNSKYDPSILPETDDAREIRKQVEFYFSDSNLPGDKHMWDLTGGAMNLPISIDNLYKFPRMKRFKPASAIIAALRESHVLDVSGAEGQEQIKRKVPFDPTTPRTKGESRTVYVKGFGDEEPSSQFDIEAFFAPYGPTNAVRLRRTEEKLFKGSVFVEFDNDETAKSFLALDPKPLWKGKHELLIQPKRDYMEKKNEEIRDGKVQPKESWFAGRGRGGRGRGFRGGDRDRDNRGGRGRGDRDRGDRDRVDRQKGGRENTYRADRDPDDWKKRREDDRANGFKDQRGGRDNRDRKSRGRGGHRDDRGYRNGDRNRERDQKKEDKPEAEVKKEAETPEKNNGGDDRPAKDIETETKTPEQNEKKRGREDDEVDNAPVAKKVDTKSEVTAEAS